ncbi:MAG: PDGLE domain-containing protein [Microcystaceae cyanobacterium]
MRQPFSKFYLGFFSFSCFVAIALSPWASSHPDGLDRVAQDLQFHEKAVETASPIPIAAQLEDYQVSGLPAPLSTSVAGLLGTLITFSATWGLGQILSKKNPSPSPAPTDKNP